jgi:hypothetical protein
MPRPDDTNESVLNVDDWIVFQTDAELASHLVILRKRLESAFWGTLANLLVLQKNNTSQNNSLTEVEQDAI